MIEARPPNAGEVRALAHQLLAWANQLVTAPSDERALSEDERQELALVLAEAGRAISRLRARIFSDIDFAGPAWDMMLEIFIREAQGYRISLEQLSAAGSWPPLTVHGRVNMLIDKQLVERRSGAPGTRDVWLSLTHEGKRKMTDFLLKSARIARPPTVAVGSTEAR